jgi:hypothetical protein
VGPVVLTPIFAHGTVGPNSLPIPRWAALWSGGAALIVSFLLLYVLWPLPRLARASAGKMLAPSSRYLHDALVVVLRTVGLVAFATTLVALWFGSINSAENIAPTLIFVIFWAGVTLASLLVGDLWQALSPFDTLAAIAGFVRDRVWRRAPEALPYDGNVATSYWPAVAGLLAFLWLELCVLDRNNIRRLALIVTIYSVVILAAAARYGRAWLRTGEAFGAFFGLIAQMAPFTIDRDSRRVRVRRPFSALSKLPTRPGITMLVLVSIGGTTFDGITRTRFWQKVLGTTTGWNYTFINTFGLIWIIGLVAIAYAIAATVTAWITVGDRYEAPAHYVPALLPIAFAYAFAHYFTNIVFEGQDIIRLASDPFGVDWNLFGTVNYVINFNVISTTTIGWTKIIVIIVGHIIAFTVAHDRAVEDDDGEVMSQLPIFVAVAAYAATALWLLLP